MKPTTSCIKGLVKDIAIVMTLLLAVVGCGKESGKDKAAAADRKPPNSKKGQTLYKEKF